MAATAYPMVIIDGGSVNRSLHFWDSTIGDGTGLLFSTPLIMQTPTQIVDSTHGFYVQLVAGTAVIGQTYGSFTTITSTITRPANTTAYANGDIFNDSTTAPTAGGFTLTSAGRASGGSGKITDILLLSSNAGALQGEIHLFDSAVTTIPNDNDAWNLDDTDTLKRIAVIPFTMVADANNSYYHAQNLNIGYTCSGTANLRYMIKVKAAYTPLSAETLTLRVKCERID